MCSLLVKKIAIIKILLSKEKRSSDDFYSKWSHCKLFFLYLQFSAKVFLIITSYMEMPSIIIEPSSTYFKSQRKA
ncbi:MAG: hypothetical protein CMH78_05725 [Nitrospinae bacterium]|nr:hypothetical protein [Nitrospinota bacterium]